MKAVLSITEKNDQIREIEFENLTCDGFRRMGQRPDPKIDQFVAYYPVGPQIFLMTSNMPPDLRDEIIHMIKHYCNI